MRRSGCTDKDRQGNWVRAHWTQRQVAESVVRGHLGRVLANVMAAEQASFEITPPMAWTPTSLEWVNALQAKIHDDILGGEVPLTSQAIERWLLSYHQLRIAAQYIERHLAEYGELDPGYLVIGYARFIGGDYA